MTALKRDIGLMGAAFVALNCVVGAGVFAMPQELAEKAGAASPYLVLVVGALVIFVALVFAELAGHFDQSGGMVVYANAAFGRFAGFQAGLFYFIARVAAMGANTNALLTYAATFTPGIDEGGARLAAIVALWLGFSAINIAGVKGAVRGLNALTIAKLAPLIILIVWGLIAFAGSIPAPQAPDRPHAIDETGLLLLYAFGGFELATLTAGETRDAKKALPRALVGTVAATMALYFLVQLTYVSIMQGAAPDGAPLAAAAQVLAGPAGALAIAGAAVLSIGGNLYAASIATPRLTFAMADGQSLPAWFGTISARFATPANSIVAVGLIVGALAMSGAFVWLAILSALARMIVYLLCTAALVKVRAHAPKRPRTLAQTIFRWAIPTVAAGLCIWAITQARPDAWLRLGAFAAAGSLLYAFSWWRPARART